MDEIDPLSPEQAHWRAQEIRRQIQEAQEERARFDKAIADRISNLSLQIDALEKAQRAQVISGSSWWFCAEREPYLATSTGMQGRIETLISIPEGAVSFQSWGGPGGTFQLSPGVRSVSGRPVGRVYAVETSLPKFTYLEKCQRLAKFAKHFNLVMNDKTELGLSRRDLAIRMAEAEERFQGFDLFWRMVPVP